MVEYGIIYTATTVQLGNRTICVNLRKLKCRGFFSDVKCYSQPSNELLKVCNLLRSGIRLFISGSKRVDAFSRICRFHFESGSSLRLCRLHISAWEFSPLRASITTSTLSSGRWISECVAQSNRMCYREI